MRLLCPGCGQARELGPEVRLGDELTCEACAGVLLQVVEENGVLSLREVPQASCPQCETRLRLPAGVQPGDTLVHCGRRLVVTYAFGAYALEPPGRF
ncbi:MAG: hypothetical protein KatS3mg131_2634 [Candidatus Tectimicrobiota bacterium]|nr:MAG: hypothetical protein KatS3mg131_2634 [Candidatus Tectomicrobia bacterium]